MTTNHPLIGRKVKTTAGNVYTVVGPTGFQPALDDMMCSEFFVPVICPEGLGYCVSLSHITVLDDESAAEDERVAKLRALALIMCGIVASEVNSLHFAQSIDYNDAIAAMSVTGIDEDDSNDVVFEKALAIIEASR